MPKVTRRKTKQAPSRGNDDEKGGFLIFAQFSRSSNTSTRHVSIDFDTDAAFLSREEALLALYHAISPLVPDLVRGSLFMTGITPMTAEHLRIWRQQNTVPLLKDLNLDGSEYRKVTVEINNPG